MSQALVKQEKPEKIPDFAKTDWYQQLLSEIRLNFTREKPLSLNKISKKLSVTQQRVSQVLVHEYSKKQLQAIVDEFGFADAPEVYQIVKANLNNPGHARLYHEYYSPIRKKDVAQSGDIIINVGVIARPIEEAEYTEIQDKDTDK